MAYIKKIEIRWSDLDPNFHLRHTAYYDFGAQHRVEISMLQGISPEVMQEQHFGPVLFKEECLFKKEIRFGYAIFIHTELLGLRSDGSRWRILHRFLSENEQILYAEIRLEGAWINTQLRKLCNPVPSIVLEAFANYPRAIAYQEI